MKETSSQLGTNDGVHVQHVIDSFPLDKLPKMSEPSQLMTENTRSDLYVALPALSQGKKWVLLYRTWRYGISPSTLYRRSNLCPGLSLLVVGDRKGAVFGGLVEAPLKPSTKKRYQVSNNTFVFTNTPGRPVIFRPTCIAFSSKTKHYITTFRQGTSELFSGSYDRTIKIWNAEDRSYITTLFGHQSDVLTIDCLRKECILTVGRDRTMHLWKIPEESQLVFRASTSSLECCCFINNDEFLSGSDDGSIEHWGVLRKKPLHIVKNAHPSLVPNKTDDDLANGNKDNVAENLCSSVQSWVSYVVVCRGSDLAASGAGNGVVRLWEIENDAKGVRPLFELPLVIPGRRSQRICKRTNKAATKVQYMRIV